MVVNIFYPIFTLKITILACLIHTHTHTQKWGSCPTLGHLPVPLVGLQLPLYPKLQKKNNVPILFLDYILTFLNSVFSVSLTTILNDSVLLLNFPLSDTDRTASGFSKYLNLPPGRSHCSS